MSSPVCAPAAKAALLRECIPRLMAEAPGWVATGAAARGAAPSEEWLAGPSATVRLFRLLAESLDAIAVGGPPAARLAARVRRSDGRTEIALFPSSTLDRRHVHGLHGPRADGCRASRRSRRASGRRRSISGGIPEGGLSVILGAGNVASIPPMDVASKMFVDGMVCVLKMNPVNEWVGPFLERALEPLDRRAATSASSTAAPRSGSALVYHPLRRRRAHHRLRSHARPDRVGAAGAGARPPHRGARSAAARPDHLRARQREPGRDRAVRATATRSSPSRRATSSRMVCNNASFNCNAAKMLITPKGWPQRSRFLDLVAQGLAAAPTRKAYYPGAFDRYRTLLSGHPEAQRFGQGERRRCWQWALVPGLDAGDEREPLFRTEPFCGMLSETSVGSTDPVEFLAEATRFMNDRLWGTLNAMLVVPPKLERDPTRRRRARSRRSSTCATAPSPSTTGRRWATPSAPCRGAVTRARRWRTSRAGSAGCTTRYMLDGIDKAVVRGPLVVKPMPMWFYGNPKADRVAPLVADLEAAPSWLKIPGILARVLF